MTRRKRIERINSAKQEMESLMNKINQTAEFAENLVQRRSAVDIIHNQNKLKLEELRGVEVPKHRQTTRNLKSFVESKFQNIARLHLSNLPPHCNTTLNKVLYKSPRSRQSQPNQV